MAGNSSRPYMEEPHVLMANVNTRMAMMFIGIPVRAYKCKHRVTVNDINSRGNKR